jgi:hypothetical protein
LGLSVQWPPLSRRCWWFISVRWIFKSGPFNFNVPHLFSLHHELFVSVGKHCTVYLHTVRNVSYNVFWLCNFEFNISHLNMCSEFFHSCRSGVKTINRTSEADRDYGLNHINKTSTYRLHVQAILRPLESIEHRWTLIHHGDQFCPCVSSHAGGNYLRRLLLTNSFQITHCYP